MSSSSPVFLSYQTLDIFLNSVSSDTVFFLYGIIMNLDAVKSIIWSDSIRNIFSDNNAFMLFLNVYIIVIYVWSPFEIIFAEKNIWYCWKWQLLSLLKPISNVSHCTIAFLILVTRNHQIVKITLFQLNSFQWCRFFSFHYRHMKDISPKNK